MLRDIVITLPQEIEWADYQRELDAVADWGGVLNFKVANLPCEEVIDGKCYIVWRGFVRGWMQIVGFGERVFTCEVTRKVWSGKFIKRSGPFHRLEEPLEMRGFQGWRYFERPA